MLLRSPARDHESNGLKTLIQVLLSPAVCLQSHRGGKRLESASPRASSAERASGGNRQRQWVLHRAGRMTDPVWPRSFFWRLPVLAPPRPSGALASTGTCRIGICRQLKPEAQRLATVAWSNSFAFREGPAHPVRPRSVCTAELDPLASGCDPGGRLVGYLADAAR